MLEFDSVAVCYPFVVYVSSSKYFSVPNAFACHRPQGKYERCLLSPPISPPRLVIDLDLARVDMEGV